MDYRFLGDTGIKISELCMGTWSFGGEADEETAVPETATPEERSAGDDDAPADQASMEEYL